MRRLPIAAQVMALVALAIMVAAGAMVAITLGGPPPRQPPLRIDRLAMILAGERMGPMPSPVVYMDTLDGQIGDLGENPQIAYAVAADLEVEPGSVRAWSEHSLPPGAGMIVGEFLIALPAEGGGWKVLRNGPDRALARWRTLTITTISAVLIALLALAWVAARHITRPIQDLARAARSSRTGSQWTLDAPAGPPEITQAANSLRDLHQRNHDHSQMRMTMLAAIAHDIGTPLARLAFRAEDLPDAKREAAMGDIVMIRSLLTDSLTLARGWSGKEEVLDFAALCRKIAEREKDTGADITCRVSGPAFVFGNPLSLERMVQNLVDNALRYGGLARLSVDWDSEMLWLRVKDGGPGFPADNAEELLKPFVRGESSRNSQTGGSGLGLAIVTQVVEAHGGKLELGRCVLGGALVTIGLPAAASQ